MKTIRLEVPTDEMVETIEQLDEARMPIVKIEDDRGGNSGMWIFTVGYGKGEADEQTNT